MISAGLISGLLLGIMKMNTSITKSKVSMDSAFEAYSTLQHVGLIFYNQKICSRAFEGHLFTSDSTGSEFTDSSGNIIDPDDIFQLKILNTEIMKDLKGYDVTKSNFDMSINYEGNPGPRDTTQYAVKYNVELTPKESRKKISYSKKIIKKDFFLILYANKTFKPMVPAVVDDPATPNEDETQDERPEVKEDEIVSCFGSPQAPVIPESCQNEGSILVYQNGAYVCDDNPTMKFIKSKTMDCNTSYGSVDRYGVNGTAENNEFRTDMSTDACSTLRVKGSEIFVPRASAIGLASNGNIGKTLDSMNYTAKTNGTLKVMATIPVRLINTSYLIPTQGTDFIINPTELYDKKEYYFAPWPPGSGPEYDSNGFPLAAFLSNVIRIHPLFQDKTNPIDIAPGGTGYKSNYGNLNARNNYETAILGAIIITGSDGFKDHRFGDIYNPTASTVGSMGGTGVVVASFPVEKDVEYSIKVNVFSFGNSEALPTNPAWFGTMKLEDHYVEGFIELMEYGPRNNPPTP